MFEPLNRLLPSSLRLRLILGNLLITFLALAGMGYYVFVRAQQANAYLTGQLDLSVQQQADDKLTSLSTEQSASLNNFFASTRKDITSLGSTTEKIISQESLFGPTFGGGTLWNAADSLTRLANGSWDNSNTEAGSVFIPARVELTDNLVRELNTLKGLDLVAPSGLKTNPDTIAIYFGGVSGETFYYPNIDLANIVPPDFDVTTRPWYVAASPAQDPQHGPVWSDPYLDAALHGLVITSSVPIFDSSGTFRGVAAMDIQLNKITDLVSNIRVGDSGYAFLIDKDKRLIAMPEAGYKDLGITQTGLPLGDVFDQSKVSMEVSPEFWDLLGKMASGASGLETIRIGGTERFIVYRPVSEVGYGLAIMVPSQELLSGAIAARGQIANVTRNTIIISALLVGAILLLALLAALGLSNRLTSPLGALTRTAEQITGGNLDAEAKVGGRDEIGTLARALNTMTSSLKELIQSLEQRVRERTSALEAASHNAERRAARLKLAAEIGNAAASVRNLDSLLNQAVRLLSLRFGFYHVGIFLLDDEGKFATLRSTNSEGGQRMLQRGHSLEVGRVGIVGYVAQSSEARIASDVGADAVFFNNPDLPGTRSEMALPLKVGGKVLGVLDIQSTESQAFLPEDIETLQVVADQLAIAIDNSRLLAESQAAVEATRRAYGEVSLQAWRERFENEASLGFRSGERGSAVGIGAEPWSPELTRTMADGRPLVTESGRTLNVPILVRGQPIGVLRLVKAGTATWTENEKETVQTLSDQLSGALDGARLYDEAQHRAAKERAIGDITSKISASINMNNVLQTAVEELGRAMPGSDIVIQFGSSADGANRGKEEAAR
jgi:GAF domain-containing protein/HAMP domain-containing protein